jgi:hypothetical protein
MGFDHDRIRKAPHNGRRGHPDGWSGHPHRAGLLGRAVTENHTYAIQAIHWIWQIGLWCKGDFVTIGVEIRF